jgi:hypothetical protein
MHLFLKLRKQLEIEMIMLNDLSSNAVLENV